MAEVKRRSSSRGEDEVEVVEEASCSGADGSASPESVPPSIAAESPSFFTWMWIQILTACSGVWGARGRGPSGPRASGLASGAQQQTQEDSESEVLSRIAASKSTWSEVRDRDVHLSVSVLCPNQLSDWQELMESNPRFFRHYPGLEIGRLIGEGGQAQIFEANLKGDVYNHVLKVFKPNAGFSLADLKRQWPRSMRKDGEDCSEFRSMQERSSPFVFEDVDSNIERDRCVIMGATLLRDETFAFLMLRYWGDLGTLIDLKVEENIHPWEFDLLSTKKGEQLPFSFLQSRWIMLQIARGMQELHAEGVLHRDLKAANVLIEITEFENRIDCDVADYECAMFVQGTGFWRAPEVWQELQKKKNGEDPNDEIWTEKVDVYSFGMTCYEILTGCKPFDGYSNSKWDDVIRGERPFLPNYIFPELRELVEACWHVEPSQRPSFDVIVGKLDSLWLEFVLQ